MGIFGPSYTPLEKQILETYTISFISMGYKEDDAKKLSKDLLDNCIKESKQEGTYNLPINIGYKLLEKEKTDEKTKQSFKVKREDGVTSEDILWWWGLNDIERRIMVAIDDVNKLSSFSQLREDGYDQNEAGKLVRKSFVICGDPNDEEHAKGEDRPLPYELKDRINIYIEKRGKDNLDKFKKEVEEYSSFNAFLRKKIKDKEI